MVTKQLGFIVAFYDLDCVFVKKRFCTPKKAMVHFLISTNTLANFSQVSENKSLTVSMVTKQLGFIVFFFTSSNES